MFQVEFEFISFRIHFNSFANATAFNMIIMQVQLVLEAALILRSLQLKLCNLELTDHDRLALSQHPRPRPRRLLEQLLVFNDIILEIRPTARRVVE